jgi:DinB superfamily
MPIELRNGLQALIESELDRLQAITEAEASNRVAGEWSRKEELGHLIDSATNNHVRFVRASLESRYEGPTYDQNGWVRLHAYNDLPFATLIDFWYRYNSLLAHIVRQIPEERFSTECVVGPSKPVTLEFLIEDYILHMQHHLDHILRRPAITQYPGAAIGV